MWEILLAASKVPEPVKEEAASGSAFYPFYVFGAFGVIVMMGYVVSLFFSKEVNDAQKKGVAVTGEDAVFLWLFRRDVKSFLRGAGRLREVGVDEKLQDLKTAVKRGVNLERVAECIYICGNHDINLPFEAACDIDTSGRDLLAQVDKALEIEEWAVPDVRDVPSGWLHIPCSDGRSVTCKIIVQSRMRIAHLIGGAPRDSVSFHLEGALERATQNFTSPKKFAAEEVCEAILSQRVDHSSAIEILELRIETKN